MPRDASLGDEIGPANSEQRPSTESASETALVRRLRMMLRERDGEVSHLRRKLAQFEKVDR